MGGIYIEGSHVTNDTVEAMACLVFDQCLRDLVPVRFNKLTHYVIAYSLISFRRCTLVQVFTNLFTKSGEGIKFVPQTLRPFVIDLRQLLGTQCAALRLFFNLLSAQTF